MATMKTKTPPNAGRNASESEGQISKAEYRGVKSTHVRSGSTSGEKFLKQLDRFAAASRDGKRR
jgi:hypothetical protein